MNRNDPFSKKNKIPLGRNRTNGAVYYKIYFKVNDKRDQLCTLAIR